jgi:D-inositol-3-phosphate glycosyltransferase
VFGRVGRPRLREGAARTAYRASPPDAAATGPRSAPTEGGGGPAVSDLLVHWSSLPSLGPTEAFRGSGKYVAGSEWTRAIIEHGTLRSVSIFAPVTTVEEHRRHFRLAQHGTGKAADQAAIILPDSELPQRLKTSPCYAMHRPLDVIFDQAAYARSRFSSKLFPITCSQMGISYAMDLYQCWIGLLSAPIQSCDAIVCSTSCSLLALEKRLNDIAERYCQAWGRPIRQLPRLEVIPWGVDTDRFAPRDQRLSRRDLGLPVDRPVVLCFGRVQIQDKMDWTPLLLAFRDVSEQLRKQQPLLVIAGSCVSDYGERLLAHAGQLGLRDHVRSFFNLPTVCLPTLYSACDVFVSPVDTPSESFGLTIVEAMACARPVVASDWDGYKELIVHGQSGFKVRTDWVDCLGELNELAPCMAWQQGHLHVGQSVSVDISQMTRYIVQLLEHPDLATRMGQHGRARVERLYSWPVVVSLWEALWKELRRIADSAEVQGSDALAYLQPNYFQHFSHYASRIIDDSVPVHLTGRGKELLGGKGLLLLHPWAQGFLRADHLHGCLQALRPTRWAGATLPVGDLLKILERAQGLSRDQALMHVMWLAKYGLLSFGEEETSDDVSSGL